MSDKMKPLIFSASEGPLSRAQAEEAFEILFNGEATQAQINQIAAPHAAWLQRALDEGLIKGPSVAIVGNLIFFFADHVINNTLGTADSDLMFTMLTNAIGLKE